MLMFYRIKNAARVFLYSGYSGVLSLLNLMRMTSAHGVGENY